MTKVTRTRSKDGLESFWNYMGAVAGTRADHEPSMTLRHQQVLRLLAQGQTMKEVAASLAISQRTVATHKYQIMRDLGLKSNADIVMFALQHRILRAPECAALSTFN